MLFSFQVWFNIICIFLQVGNNENNTNSVEASETMSTNSASSPIPYSFNHSSSIDLMNENDTKRRHRSSTDDNKMVRTVYSIGLVSRDSIGMNLLLKLIHYDDEFRWDLKLLRPPKYRLSLVPLPRLWHNRQWE